MSEIAANHGSVPIGSWKGVFARRRECSLLGWLFAIYDRVLLSRLGRFLPFRGKIVLILLKDNPAPFFIRLGTSDWMSLEEIFIRHVYRSVCDLCLSNEPNILDLGANVGLSARFWKMVFPNAFIMAVEPDSENITMCRKNMKGHESRFALLEACAGGVRRRTYLDRSEGEWGIKMRETGQDGEVSVDVLTVADILQGSDFKGEIDLLKCDIEGAEQEVFAKCSTWIYRVRNLLIEIHGGYSADGLLRDLAANGAFFETEELGSGASYRILLLRKKEPRE
jgi:FkbM family methyltransferase